MVPHTHKYDYINYRRILVFIMFLVVLGLFFVVLSKAQHPTNDREVIVTDQGYPIIMESGAPYHPEDMH